MDDLTIRNYARRFRLGVIAAYGVIVFLVIFGHLGMRIGNVPVVLESRSTMNSAELGVGDAVLLLIGVAIYWLSEALRAIDRGELFSQIVVRRFRLFASWMLLAALVYSLAPTLLASATSPNGVRRLTIMIDVRDLLMIGVTLLILLIARMFERARAIQDEMSEIV